MTEPVDFGPVLPPLTVAQVAILLGKTTRTIRTYLSRSLDPLPAERGRGRKMTMIPLQELIEWMMRERLRELRVTPDGDVLDLQTERAKLARAQRELTEQTTATRAGELIAKDEVVSGIGRLVSNARQRLLGLPSRVGAAYGPDAAGFTGGLIHEALIGLAAGE